MFKDFKPEIPPNRARLARGGKLFLLVALIAVVVSVGGIFLLQGVVRNQVSPTPVPPLSSPQPQPEVLDTSGWQTYRNDEFGFEIKYPENARLIIPTWNSISDKPSAVIIKFNFQTGCINKLMDFGIKEEDAIVECWGYDVDIAILGEKQETLRDFVREESHAFSETDCNVQTKKIGAIDSFELSNRSETGGCLVGDSSFYYLEKANKIFKIGISDNTDEVTNQILATFRFVEQ